MKMWETSRRGLQPVFGNSPGPQQPSPSMSDAETSQTVQEEGVGGKTGLT